MGIPFYVICCDSFVTLNICPLCIFICLFVFILINVCFDVFSLGFIPMGHTGIFHLRCLFFFPFQGNFNYFLFKYFLMPFPFVFVLRETYDLNMGTFNIVP